MGSCSEMMKSSSLQMTVSTDFLFFVAAAELLPSKRIGCEPKKNIDFVASDEVVLFWGTQHKLRKSCLWNFKLNYLVSHIEFITLWKQNIWLEDFFPHTFVPECLLSKSKGHLLPGGLPQIDREEKSREQKSGWTKVLPVTHSLLAWGTNTWVKMSGEQNPGNKKSGGEIPGELVTPYRFSIPWELGSSS